MNNATQLYAETNAETGLSEHDSRIAAAVTDVLTSNAKLGRALREFSNRFDSVDTAIETIDNTEIRCRLKQSIQLGRASLSKVALELSQSMRAANVIGSRGKPRHLDDFRLPTRYRGISYDIARTIDVDICWRWVAIVLNDRRLSGQTKISRRAAEIQAQVAIDLALARRAQKLTASAGTNAR
jgi:hypothetical protein